MLTILRAIDLILSLLFPQFEANPLGKLPIILLIAITFLPSLPLDLALVFRKKIKDVFIRKLIIFAWIFFIGFYINQIINNLVVINI